VPRSWPHLQVHCLSRGGPRGHYRYLADRVPLHTSFKSRQGAGCAPTCRHMSCGTGPCLPAKVCSEATTRPVTPDSASLIGRAPMPPSVSWLRTRWEGSDVPPSCGSGSCLHTGRAPGCHASCDSLWATGLKPKKNLAGLPVQLGSHVPNACALVSKASDIRAITDLQDVWAGSVINACKTCG
jgi:hypothetical protein